MNKVIKIASAATAAAVALGVGAAFTTMAESNQGPDRKSYTMESLKSATLGKTPVFNSVTDNTYINGSEFNFTGARLATATDGTQANSITVDANTEMLIRLYVHNNNASSVAEGVKAKVDLGGSGTEVTAKGYIDVNTNGSTYSGAISEYWDDIVFKSSGSFTFHLEYEEAHIETGKMNVALSEDIVKDGATIGYEALDGKMPGCYDKAAYVYVKVKVVPEYTVSKQVRLEGAKDWAESVEAKVGDTVEYRVEFFNRAGVNTGNVTLVDVLPPNEEYIKGSTEMMNGSTGGKWVKVDQDTITTTGLNVNSYETNSNVFVRFKTKVVDSNLTCNKNNILRNWAKATVTSAKDNKTATAVITDFADTTVNKVCNPNPDPNPDPTPTPTPDPVTPVNPSTPSEMPTTGPTEVVSGIVGAGALTTAAGYYIASRKQLR